MPFVTDRLAQQNGSPALRVSPGELSRRLAAGVLGQDRAVEAVTRAVTLARAGLVGDERPLANLLLVGPTGVGKTELVRRLAAILRSGPDDLCRVDMSALAQEHYAASFSGAPPGYAGSKEGYSLFERTKIEGDPYTPGIVLFDEVEKAHPTVLRALLQVLDHGILRLANGQERVEFRNCFVFMTSNLGSRQLSRLLSGPVGHAERWRHRNAPRMPGTQRVMRSATGRIANREIRRFFDPEFLNRLDEVVIMNDLEPEVARQIVRLRVEELTSRAARRSVDLTVSPAVIDLLLDTGFDPAYGARNLQRAVRRHLSVPLAHAMADRTGRDRPLRLLADLKGGEVSVTRV